jgi:hypothetical protein
MLLMLACFLVNTKIPGICLASPQHTYKLSHVCIWEITIRARKFLQFFFMNPLQDSNYP